jgi:hypothetical protein
MLRPGGDRVSRGRNSRIDSGGSIRRNVRDHIGRGVNSFHSRIRGRGHAFRNPIL